MTTVLDCSGLDGTSDGGGDNLITWRIIVHAAALTAATGNQAQVSFRTGTVGDTVATITGAWIGQRSGTTNNFTGNQVQLKFSGASTVAWNVANTTILSDVVTLGENFDNTKDYIVSVRVTNAGNLATTTAGTFTNVDANFFISSSAGEEALTTATAGYTSQAGKDQFLRQIFITSSASATGTDQRRRSPARWSPRRGPLAGKAYVETPIAIATTNASLTQDNATLDSQAQTADFEWRHRRPTLKFRRSGPLGSWGYRPEQSLIVGYANAALTQADAALSAATAVLVQPSAALTQADASLSAATGVLVQPTASLTQANASLSAASAVLVQATALLTQADFSLSADASVSAGGGVNASATLTQDDFSLLAAASVSGIVALPQTGGTSGAGRRVSARYRNMPLRLRTLRKRLETLEEIAERLESAPEWSSVVEVPETSRDYLSEARALVADLEAVRAADHAAAAAQMLARARELEEQFEEEAAALLLLLH